MKNIKADKLRYQTNSSAYALVMLSVAFSVVALFTLITYDAYGELELPYRVIPDFRIGLEIVLGIIMMLATFLAAEKIKYYSKSWAFYGLFILAGINLARIFNIPLYAFNNEWIPQTIKVRAIIELAASALLLVGAAVITIRKILILNKHLKELEENGETTV